MSILLGVNIDHIATLRQARGTSYPSVLEAMRACERARADQITIHLREDRRHIQDEDVRELLKHSKLPINLEMALVDEMIANALRWKPYSVTLVPEKRAEMTTESGLDLSKLGRRALGIERLKKRVKVYGFIDPVRKQVELAREFHLDGVEFHTGPYCEAFEKNPMSPATKKQIKMLFEAAEKASACGLEVKAGHGLTLENISELLHMPHLKEVNIGHSIVARAVFVGLEEAIREMKRLLA